VSARDGFGLRAALALVCAALGIFVLTREPSAPVPAPAAQPAPASAPAAASLPAAAPASLPSREVALKGAHDAMEREIALLAKNDYAAFAAAFTVPVTREQFDVCKKRMSHAHLSPDWEMAEIGDEGGHRVLRVSIFGKGMTGFHEIGGVWRADTVWCVPIW
jgi:hypothetical protein